MISFLNEFIMHKKILLSFFSFFIPLGFSVLAFVGGPNIYTGNIISHEFSAFLETMECIILFGTSFLFVSVFKKLPAPGSRLDPDDKFEFDKLRSRACMIDFPVVETD